MEVARDTWPYGRGEFAIAHIGVVELRYGVLDGGAHPAVDVDGKLQSVVGFDGGAGLGCGCV
jgi:hypothetical protein